MKTTLLNPLITLIVPEGHCGVVGLFVKAYYVEAMPRVEGSHRRVGFFFFHLLADDCELSPVADAITKRKSSRQDETEHAPHFRRKAGAATEGGSGDEVASKVECCRRRRKTFRKKCA